MQGIWVGLLMRELRPFAHAKRKPSQLLSLCALEPMFCNKGSPRKVRKGNKMTSPQSKQVFSSVQFSHSVVSDSLRPHEPPTRQASLSITNSHSLPKLMCIESVMPSNHLILCHPLLLPSIFPNIRISKLLTVTKSFPY